MQPPSRLFRSRSRGTSQPVTYSSSAAYRAALLAASSRRRTLSVGGRVFRFTPTQRGGNCGFQAIAWALIIAGRGGPAVSSEWVRSLASRAVKEERSYWVARVGEREEALPPLSASVEVESACEKNGESTPAPRDASTIPKNQRGTQDGVFMAGGDCSNRAHGQCVVGQDVESAKPCQQEPHHGGPRESSCSDEDCGESVKSGEEGSCLSVPYHMYRDEDGASVSHGDASEENSAPPSNSHCVPVGFPVSPPVSLCDTDARSCTTSQSVSSSFTANLISARPFSTPGRPNRHSIPEAERPESPHVSEQVKQRWLARVLFFEKSVLSTGLNGHWLGQCWGELELSVLARALDIRIELFAFDTRSQQPRSYHVDGDPSKLSVSLLFTGTAEAGHFDLLQEEHGNLPRRKRPSRTA